MYTHFKIGTISRYPRLPNIMARLEVFGIRKSKVVCGMIFSCPIENLLRNKNTLSYYQFPTKLLHFGLDEIGSFNNLLAEQKHKVMIP